MAEAPTLADVEVAHRTGDGVVVGNGSADGVPGLVVVGVDGSAGSRAALGFAVHEATRRGLEVVVVMADVSDASHSPTGGHENGMSAMAALMTAPAAAMVERVGPPVRVPCPDRRLQRVLAEEVGPVALFKPSSGAAVAGARATRADLLRP